MGDINPLLTHFIDALQGFRTSLSDSGLGLGRATMAENAGRVVYTFRKRL